MTILYWSQSYQSYSVLFENIQQSYVHRETYQRYSVLFQNIWQSDVDPKLIKAIQVYSKTYDNLTLIGNLSKLFSSIPKHMRILCWSETYQSYSVLFQNIWQSYIDRKLIKAIQVHSKAYDKLRMIGKLIKAIQLYSKAYGNLILIRNLSKLFRSIPKHMKILRWLETYQSYSVLFQNIWQSYVDQELIKAIQVNSKAYDSLRIIGKLIKAIQFYFKAYGSLTLSGNIIKAIQFYLKTYDNLTLIGNLWKLFSSIRKHVTILCWLETTILR